MTRIFVATAAIGLFFSAHDALAGQTCAYVLGEVDGKVVTTASVILASADSGIDVDPVIVHLDETEQNILGYSLFTPAVDEGWDPPEIFVPGGEYAGDAGMSLLSELDINLLFCLEGGVITPAIPVYIPASELQAPGAFTNIPGIHFNLAGREWSLPGKLLETEGRSVVIPAVSVLFPPRHIEVPDGTIGIELDGDLEIIDHLEAAN